MRDIRAEWFLRFSNSENLFFDAFDEGKNAENPQKMIKKRGEYPAEDTRDVASGFLALDSVAKVVLGTIAADYNSLSGGSHA